jgi:hypothetical protein
MKKTVIQLANSLVTDNEYQSWINQCKSECHLLSSGLLGDAWHRGFMNWQKDTLSKKGSTVLSKKGSTVKDVNRSTWVTIENFESMYENIYEYIVDAEIAGGKKTRFNMKQDALHILYSPSQNA